MPHQPRRQFIGLSTSALAGALVPGPVKRLFAPPTAEITVHLTQSLGEIAPTIYGQFIEHLGRAIYGGIYDEQHRQFRPDVLEKVQRLRPPLLRYPGGTVTKIYHWKDGVGQNRPVRKNLIWGGYDTNQVGTDEFVQYARLLGAAPFLTVNMSTGTAEEAADWVEYCNATQGYYAAQRQANGHAAPYQVKYWGLGNEEAAKEDAGRLQDPRDYVKQAWYYAKLMKLQDPTIQLIMVGDKPDWNQQILQELHPICDYISLHLYANSKPGDPASLFASIAEMEVAIKTTAAQIKALTPERVTGFSKWYRFPSRQQPVKIALDEWGIWENGGKGAYDLEVDYTWNHALGVATFLNIFQRNAAVIGLATWAQTVNVLAPIMTNETTSICQTIYYPMELYRRLCGPRSVAATTTGAATLDVSASTDGKTLTLAIVNRDSTAAITVKINAKVAGRWIAHELNAPSVAAMNTLQAPDTNVVSYKQRTLLASATTYTVAAHGITLLQAAL
ncbi:alpha-L-arabinofuranosidase C-terminal domain-containing protein [Hymenobacter bucti]|uniref:non-reducing end alpha-L-arabinofuranosidase n=1 Tax=Hymenobacter bucti TaxID=1844114 RepID=A0ABW4QTJ4_9BACT